jgi:septal ring factor EnvC (AmiA/AmiB activator)
MRWRWGFVLALGVVLYVDSTQVQYWPGAAEVDRLRQGQKRLQRVQRQIKQYRHQLRQNAVKEQSVLSRLETISQRQEETGRELHHLEQQALVSQQRAQELQQEHVRWSEQVQQQRGALEQRLRTLYKLGRLPYITLLLSARDIMDLAYKVQLTRRIAQHDRQQLQQYQEGFKQAALAQEALAAEQQRLQVYQDQIQQKHLSLTRERQQKQHLLHRLQEEKQLVARTVEELVQTAKDLTRFLEKLQSAATQAATSRVAKGQIPWPINGPLLSSYGQVRHPQLDVYTLQKGVYIGAAVGSDIRAIGAGKVLYADWFKGFGRLLIIDHGGHLVSLYGHTSAILVEVGADVQLHQVVAKVGESSPLGKPALYFEIRHHTVPQDPLLWLTRRTARVAE